VGDKNLRINNLQKEFEELKNKIKHVENKNERILTKLKSFKDDSREKSRSRANNSIHKDKSGQLSNQHSIAHSLGPIAQYPNATVSFGRDDRPTQDVFYTQNQRKEDRPTQDYLTRYPLKESVNSSYGLLMEENVALK
jgi:septal ring factor EnvC (AmiA/AmiB activator)